MALKVDPVNRLRSQPTSCSRSSTSGRRSTSRRPPQAPLSTPERARLLRPRCLARARVMAAWPMCGRRWQPLSAVPTLWARPRAVNESGGGRLPRHSPLGGGWAAYEGAEQPWGLEPGPFQPHSHVLPASPALSLALLPPCRRLQSSPPATKRIHSGRTDLRAAAAAAVAATARVAGPGGRQQ